MAKNGYLIIFIDDPHVGKRKAVYAGLYGIASAAGTPVMGVQVFDTLRALDYLLTREDVDPGRIGVSGLCQGSEVTWLAAALEDRFQVVSPVCGTTTYEWWARMPGYLGISLSDLSPYVENILRYADWDAINACIAPRPLLIASNSGDNWWPKLGFDKVVATLNQIYGMYGQPNHLKVVWDKRSHSMTPYIKEIDEWFEKHLKPLPESNTKPKPCTEPIDPDTNMIRYFQRRICKYAATFPNKFSSVDDWKNYHSDIIDWLRDACAVDELNHGQEIIESREEEDGLTIETIYLAQDKEFACPAVTYRAVTNIGKVRPAIILSHSERGCAMDKPVKKMAHMLAHEGFMIVVPDHVSTNKATLRPLSWKAGRKNLISLYGVADTVGRPPLAMRVWDDLTCVEYLSKRPDVAKEKIVIVGMGLGGVDAALTASLDKRIAAVASIGAITVQDWAEKVAPTTHLFDHPMPYLPSITTKTDLQYFYAAVAPRPLLLVKVTDRKHWPVSGFDRVQNTAAAVYKLYDAEDKLTVMPAKAKWGMTEVCDWLRTNFATP